MTGAATAAPAPDFADVGNEMGDDAVAAAIGAARIKAKLPAGYSMRLDGLYFDDGGDAGAVRICGRVEVLAQTRNLHGESWGLLLSWRDGDGREHRWSMPKSLLAGEGGQVREALLDRGLYLSPLMKAKNRLLDFLASVSIDRRARAVSRVGWADGCFALPDRTIGHGDAEVIYQGTALQEHDFREAGALEDWQEAVARYGVGNSRLAVALSSAFVGPLLSLLGEEGGGLHFRGGSSIGKSTALFAAGSVWGAPSILRQWRATGNGLEGVAELFNETLLCLDEIGQLDPREAGQVAYMLANGSGKSRASRTGSARAPARWKVFFLSSGEISLADLAGQDGRTGRRSAAGQEVRILDVEADAGVGLGVFEVLHDAPTAEALARRIKDGAAVAHGVAGPMFVKALLGRTDKIVPALKAGVDDFIATHVGQDGNGQAVRAARRFGLIAAAGEVAVRMGILPWPAGNATSATATLYETWLAGRGGAGAAEDREAISQVRTFLGTHGGSRFESFDRYGDDEHRPVINRAGFWRKADGLREYLILPDAWKREVCAGMDAARTAKVLAAAGMLERDSQGRNSVVINLPTIGKSRVYVVRPSIFGGEDA